MKKILVLLFMLFFLQHSYALTRNHEYIITVVDAKNKPLENIIIKTQVVRGYDQNSRTCITSSEGRCSLKFNAFAPRNTVVIVSLGDENETGNTISDITLPPVESSFFKNDDSVKATLIYDIEQIKVKQSARLNRQKSWELNNGPNLSEFSISEPVFIATYLKSLNNFQTGNVTRDKFETDEEFNNRTKKLASSFFYFDLPVNDASKCTSDFKHSESVYKVSCKINSKNQPLLKFEEVGSSFVLSNAFDKREIKRTIINFINFPIDFDWNAEFKLDRELARMLNSDLAIGFINEGKVDINSSCELCESRDRQDASAKTLDNLNSLSESLSVISGRRRTYTPPAKGWKDDAFREGVIIEDWTRKIGINSLKSIIIFRKSNNQVLFKLDQE
jgi:hypothetical protein